MKLKSTLKYFTLFAVVALSLQGGSYGQSQTQVLGKVNGIVKDTHDAAIPSVSIFFERKVDGKKLKLKVESNDDGVYQLELPVGLYRVKVKFSGYRHFEYKELNVEVSKTINLDIVLKENPRRYTGINE
jgi:hypothetical protein